MKCKWEKDVHGFYITPLIGVSSINGAWSIWVGWFYWLATWQITSGIRPARPAKKEEL